MKVLFRMVTKDDGLENFTEKLKWYLLRREGSSAYPRNNEVMTCLEELDLYNNHNICPHVLSILENANKDTLDTLVRVGNKDLSIEHVMPQKKSDAWREEIGEQYDDVHQTWLHRLDNLTLTSYNSEYGNKPYSVKRELKDDGFLVSGLRLNAAMKENEHWTEDVISARNKQLVSDFIRFMPEIVSSYAPPVGDVEEPSEFTLEEDDSFFSNVDIKGYSLLGVKHMSKNGVAAFVSLMSDIYQIDPEKMMFLEKEKKPGHLGVGLSSDPDYVNEHHGYASIGHNIWVYKKDIQHSTKVSIIRRAINAFSIDPKDVAFIGIKDGNNATDDGGNLD